MHTLFPPCTDIMFYSCSFNFVWYFEGKKGSHFILANIIIKVSTTLANIIIKVSTTMTYCIENKINSFVGYLTALFELQELSSVQ